MKPVPNRKTYQEIIKKAGFLFAKKGYFGISMNDIAKEIRITKAALYYHFESKDALYLKVLEETFSSLKENLTESLKKDRTPLDNLLTFIETYLSFSLRQPAVGLLLNDDLKDNDFLSNHIKFLRKELLNIFQTVLTEFGRTRRWASEKIVFTANLLLSLVSHSIILAAQTPHRLAKNIVNFLL